MALTRTVNCDGILQTKKTKTDVHIFYSYVPDASVNAINFDFTYQPDPSVNTVINVSGNYDIANDKIGTYNVGGGIIDSSILTDLRDSVLKEIAKDPETFTDLNSAPDASVPDSSDNK